MSSQPGSFTVIYEIKSSDGTPGIETWTVRIGGMADQKDAAANACLHALRMGAAEARPLFVVDEHGTASAADQAGTYVACDGITCVGEIFLRERIGYRKSIDFWEQFSIAEQAQQLVRQLMVALDIGPKDSIQDGIDRLRERALKAEKALADLQAKVAEHGT